MTPETQGSSPFSQQPATGPYHEPTESTLHPAANLLISLPYKGKAVPLYVTEAFGGEEV
jgi:hypothetical protein